MTSGQEELLRAQQQVEKLDSVLDEYEQANGIERGPYNEEVKEYLNLTRPQMLAMTGEECSIARFILEQYSFYIQKLLNKEISRASWCESNIDIIFAREANSYKIMGSFQSKEEIKGLVINGNSYCKKLNDLRVAAQNRINRLHGLPEKISYMSSALRSLENSKNGR